MGEANYSKFVFILRSFCIWDITVVEAIILIFMSSVVEFFNAQYIIYHQVCWLLGQDAGVYLRMNSNKISVTSVAVIGPLSNLITFFNNFPNVTRFICDHIMQYRLFQYYLYIFQISPWNVTITYDRRFSLNTLRFPFYSEKCNSPC